MVELHLDRLPLGRSVLELDHDLVREDQVLHGQTIPGFAAHVSGELDVEAMDQKILVHGEFTARRIMLCDRSGESFEMDYPVTAEILVYRNPTRGTDETMSEDDNWVIQQASGVLDLTEALLEAVVLDEPQHVVHPDHRDQPLSELIGEKNVSEDDIDPRWEALRQLKAESEGSESDSSEDDSTED